MRLGYSSDALSDSLRWIASDRPATLETLFRNAAAGLAKGFVLLTEVHGSDNFQPAECLAAHPQGRNAMQDAERSSALCGRAAG